jgi:4'-phosphopantetheinyl transferase EntD
LSIIVINSYAQLEEDLSPWPGIERLRTACLGLLVLRRETLPPMGNHLFTPRELAKSSKMGPRRKKSFTASRIALKSLTRQLGLVEEQRADRVIETLGPDNQRPCLGESGLYCSVSHSSRFVVAVAHRHPVGVDIEEVSNRILRIGHLFLSPGELQLLSQNGLDFSLAATRIWSIKESAAKALGFHLFQAFREVEVIKMENEASSIKVQGKIYPVKHTEGEGQVIALITCDDL